MGLQLLTQGEGTWLVKLRRLSYLFPIGYGRHACSLLNTQLQRVIGTLRAAWSHASRNSNQRNAWAAVAVSDPLTQFVRLFDLYVGGRDDRREPRC